MSILWTPPTLADLLGDNALPVRCICGRTTNPDMMVVITALPLALRERLGLEAHEAICDACVQQLTYRDRIGRPALLRALGAPDALVARHRQRAQRDNEPLDFPAPPSLPATP